MWISLHGPTTENELGEKIEAVIKSERQALEFASVLDDAAHDYIAILSPEQNPRWSYLTESARHAIKVISRDLESEQIRPLMLAIARHFDPKKASKAFPSLLSWAVRFLIVGGGGGGKLDRYYGLRAKEATEGKIKTKRALVEAMGDALPRDRQFEEEFARVNVRKAPLARYYLRAIENWRADDPHPALLISENTSAVNLEHVLPVTPGPGWTIDTDTAATFHKRLGNMVLLGSQTNVDIANGSFEEKRSALEGAPFSVTREVAEYREWGPEQIKARQIKLASVAAKVWPI